MLVLVSVLAFVVVGRVLAPVRELGDTARSITDPTSRAASTSAATTRSPSSAHVQRDARPARAGVRAQREFVSDAGHELRTPITIIRGHLELLGDDPDDAARPSARHRRARPHEPLRRGPADAGQGRAPRLPAPRGPRPRPADRRADGQGARSRRATGSSSTPAPGC